MAFVSRGILHGECQGTNCKGPESLSTIIVQMIRLFLWYLKGRQKKLFKNSCFHSDNSFSPIFSRIIECDKAEGAVYKGLQAILKITVDL